MKDLKVGDVWISRSCPRFEIVIEAVSGGGVLYRAPPQMPPKYWFGSSEKEFTRYFERVDGEKT